MKYDILIVDDEEDIRSLVGGILEDEGYEARFAKDGAAAIRQIESALPSLILLDVWLNDSRYDGISLLDVIRKDYPGIPVVMISGHGTIETAVRALKGGAYDFIEKPFNTERFLLVVQHALENHRLKTEVIRLKRGSLGEELFIGESSESQLLKSSIQKIAANNSRVFISGPIGVGKEHAARCIHEGSKRAKHSFVSISCATLDYDSLERALFGYFSHDTQESVQGVFEQAHKGTLYIEEISLLPPYIQSSLLKVLQEGVITRHGADISVKLDVRVISSTANSMPQLIESKKFREDLYNRLNVATLNISPLSKRRQDIPDLVRHFCKELAESFGLPNLKISNETIMFLQTCKWPGNLRQLKNALEWVLLSSSDPIETIEVHMLPQSISGETKVTASDSVPEFLSSSLKDARQAFEKKYLQAQVSRFDGNISKTSEFVGMERSALHRKLRTLGVHYNSDESAEENSQNDKVAI